MHMGRCMGMCTSTGTDRSTDMDTGRNMYIYKDTDMNIHRDVRAVL